MSDDTPPRPFRCDVTIIEDAAWLRPTGELDISTVPVLEARFRQAHADGHRRIVLDLRELDFMDSTGLTLLTRWSLGAERDGYDFALVAGRERIQRLFELTRLLSHFTFVEG